MRVMKKQAMKVDENINASGGYKVFQVRRLRTHKIQLFLTLWKNKISIEHNFPISFTNNYHKHVYLSQSEVTNSWFCFLFIYSFIVQYYRQPPDEYHLIQVDKIWNTLVPSKFTKQFLTWSLFSRKKNCIS